MMIVVGVFATFLSIEFLLRLASDRVPKRVKKIVRVLKVATDDLDDVLSVHSS